MACFMPFSNKNLDILVFVLRPTVAIVDDLIDTLKKFCFFTETLGCIHSSIFKSIHGNMIIWYGAWIKRSQENKELLREALLSVLTNLSSMAILIDEHFLDAFGGEARDGSPSAQFSTGDTLCLSSTMLSSSTKMNDHDFLYACLATFKSRFSEMDGTTSGVCLKCDDRLMVVNFYVWKNLQSCYSFVLKNDHRQVLKRYFHGVKVFVKYDVFKVEYVSADNVSSFQYYPPHRLLDNQAYEIVDDLE